MSIKNLKYRIRDSIIALIVYSGVTALYCKYIGRRHPLVRVLCFHDVPDRRWFEEVVKVLHSHFHIITPKQFHNQEFSPTKINVLLTFDDGYQSWIDVCMPVLDSYGVKAIFFISSGLLDSVSGGAKESAAFVKNHLHLYTTRNLLNWDQARSIVSSGHTVGGHTVSHRSLVSLSVDDMVKEVMKDKEKLEAGLSTSVSDFAYPFGRTSDVSEQTQAVVQSYYSYVYSAVPEFFQVGKNMIGRTLIDTSIKPTRVRHWVVGGYDVLKHLTYI